MKAKYQDFNFRDSSLEMIGKVNDLIASYLAKGYSLTLRQIYYQFVSRNWLPAKWADPKTGSTNNPKSYAKLGDLINNGRLAGLIDWGGVEDRTRNVDGNTHWTSPEAIIRAVSQQYQIDKWQDQNYFVEVWVEKDALEGVVSRACRALDVGYLSCRGYTSQTAMYDSGARMLAAAKSGRTPTIIHLGDHDPSGIDMSRDIEQRIRMFMRSYGDMLEFERIMLNMDQVKRYAPPPNPAKSTDSRFESYNAEYGEESWELDALEPEVIDKLIRKAILKRRNEEQFDDMKAKEQKERGELVAVYQNWEDVVLDLPTVRTDEDEEEPEEDESDEEEGDEEGDEAAGD